MNGAWLWCSYARALTAEEQNKVAAVLTQHIQQADLIITTAAIPGKPSPKLISTAQVAGWVIIGHVPAILHTPLMSGSNSSMVSSWSVESSLLLNATNVTEQTIAFFAVLLGAANAAGGYPPRRTLRRVRFAMIEDGLGFQLVPWQPVLEKRLDQHISGVRRDDGGIEWSFTRNRQIGLGL